MVPVILHLAARSKPTKANTKQERNKWQWASQNSRQYTAQAQYTDFSSTGSRNASASGLALSCSTIPCSFFCASHDCQKRRKNKRKRAEKSGYRESPALGLGGGDARGEVVPLAAHFGLRFTRNRRGCRAFCRRFCEFVLEGLDTRAARIQNAPLAPKRATFARLRLAAARKTQQQAKSHLFLQYLMQRCIQQCRFPRFSRRGTSHGGAVDDVVT